MQKRSIFSSFLYFFSLSPIISVVVAVFRHLRNKKIGIALNHSANVSRDTTHTKSQATWSMGSRVYMFIQLSPAATDIMFIIQITILFINDDR